MNRREAIARGALVMGGTILGAQAFVSSCTRKSGEVASIDFPPEIISMLDAVGETILPKTADSPGAAEVKIGEFMKIIVNDCYDESKQKIFLDGVNQLNKDAEKKYSRDFMSLDQNEKHDFLTGINNDMNAYNKSKKGDDPEHYFSQMKYLTLWGYFTSEEGSTKALRYLPVPTKWEGCIDYKKGDKAWAAI